MGQRLGRPKSGQKRLTRERIITTALRLIDKHGADALSMRRLASELGVDPMAIYHHLPGKRAVLGGVSEAVFNELRVPQIGGPWQEQVRAFVQAYRDVIRAHPQLVLYLVTDLEAGGGAVLRANEILYAALATAGLSPQLIVAAADLVVDYVHGVALAEGLARAEQPPEPQGVLQLLERYPADQFPVQRRVFDSLPASGGGPDSEAGLEIILVGIEAMVKNAGQ